MTKTRAICFFLSKLLSAHWTSPGSDGRLPVHRMLKRDPLVTTISVNEEVVGRREMCHKQKGKVREKNASYVKEGECDNCSGRSNESHEFRRTRRKGWRVIPLALRIKGMERNCILLEKRGCIVTLECLNALSCFLLVVICVLILILFRSELYDVAYMYSSYIACGFVSTFDFKTFLWHSLRLEAGLFVIHFYYMHMYNACYKITYYKNNLK